MAKQSAPRVMRKTKKLDLLALDAVNYYILLAGAAVILLGYGALSMGPWDGFMPLTVAPILLVAGYCVIIPLGIVYRKKTKPVHESGEPDSMQTA
ncbi:MAG: hypothetical protein ACM3Q4_01470 [Acidobacteriota bacterium]